MSPSTLDRSANLSSQLFLHSPYFLWTLHEITHMDYQLFPPLDSCLLSVSLLLVFNNPLERTLHTVSKRLTFPGLSVSKSGIKGLNIQLWPGCSLWAPLQGRGGAAGSRRLRPGRLRGQEEVICLMKSLPFFSDAGKQKKEEWNVRSTGKLA